MLIRRKEEKAPSELPKVVSIDFINEQNRSTIRNSGKAVRSVLTPAEASDIKNADLYLIAAKNGKNLNLLHLPKNFLILVKEGTA